MTERFKVDVDIAQVAKLSTKYAKGYVGSNPTMFIWKCRIMVLQHPGKVSFRKGHTGSSPVISANGR